MSDLLQEIHKQIELDFVDALKFENTPVNKLTYNDFYNISKSIYRMKESLMCLTRLADKHGILKEASTEYATE